MKIRKPTFLAFIFALFYMQTALAATPPIFSTSEGAIEGYDPVAYFTEEQPVKGKDEYSFEYNGGVFKFASAENLALFTANPEKYAPQYGGYCAYAVSEGYTAKIDPDAWTIVDDKLYLNYNQSIRKRWSKDIPGRIAKANENWPKVLN